MSILSTAEWVRLSGFGAAVAALHLIGWGLFVYYSRAQPGPRRASACSPTRSGCATRSTPTTSRRSTTRRASSSQDGKRPLGVGFFFSLGHSTIVFSLARRARGRRQDRSTRASRRSRTAGGYVGAGRLRHVPLDHRRPQPARAARHRPHLPRDAQPARTTRSGSSSGCSTAAHEPLLPRRASSRRIRVELADVSARRPVRARLRHGDRGRPARARRRRRDARTCRSSRCSRCPILFAAGMSLMDTADGAFMSQAYGWAFSNPVRKVYYNITVTTLSVAVALVDRHGRAAAGARDQARARRRLLGLARRRSTSASSATAIVGRFVLTWASRSSMWKNGRIEERWGAMIDG